MIDDASWLVVWKRDDLPVEVFSFADQESAERFYVNASDNWTDVYLCRVVHGSGPQWGPRPEYLKRPQ